MKIASTIAGLAGAAALASISVPAVAATDFSGSIDHIDLHNSGDGLLVYANPLSNSNFNFSLNEGESKTISNFLKIGTNEGSVEIGEDTVAKAITVFFDFDNPFDNTGTISGQTTGYYTFSLFGDCGAFAGGCGYVNFDKTFFNFGPGNSGKFSLDLSDASFKTPGSANISATFNLISSAVPEPATWAMMILGFGLIGGAMRRRQNQTVQYNFA